MTSKPARKPSSSADTSVPASDTSAADSTDVAAPRREQARRAPATKTKKKPGGQPGAKVVKSSVTGKVPMSVSAKERLALAINLRMTGMSYQQIADQVGYGSRSACRTAVVTALEETVNESAAEYRRVQTSRYEQLMMTHWGKAIDPKNDGNIGATHVVLSIMDKINAINGINAPIDVNVQHSGGATVILYAGGSKDDYMQSLKDAREAQAASEQQQQQAIEAASEERSAD